jgi:5-methylcytosine-specific restriction endonuclease McrA
MRAKFTKELRSQFRDWWYDEYGWYPSPDEYDIHHIKPLSRGGTNHFENLVPLKRGADHDQFTTWWLSYP